MTTVANRRGQNGASNSAGKTVKQDLALAKVGLTPSDNRYFVN